MRSAQEAIHDTLDEAQGLQSQEVALLLKRRAETMRIMQEAARAAVGDALSGAMQRETETVEAAAADIADIDDVRVEDMEGNVAGYAMMGEGGSTAVDLRKTVREDGTIDTEQLQNVVDHEDEHERQAAEANASAIVVDGVRLAFRREIAETGAMSRQTTVSGNSADYQEIFRTTTRFASAGDIREVGRSGDMVGLAETLQQKGHVVMVEGRAHRLAA